MRIENEVKLDFDDVLFKPKRSILHSRKNVDITRTFTFNDEKHTLTPIIASNMDGVGTITMAKALNKFNAMTAISKFYDDELLIEHFNDNESCINSIYTLGANQTDYEKFIRINNKSQYIKWVCIDVANGYSEKFIDFVARFHDTHPDKILMAGNVVTPDATEELILKGVFAVKVGIGPGSMCTTRKITGVGIPQLSAIIECADAAHGLNAHVISDGGCNYAGDISKAFGAGADFVMIGGMFSGTAQSELKPEFIDGKLKIKFYGMSSEIANKTHYGVMSDYKAAEGKEVLVDYKGHIDDIMKEILGGIRSTCTYIGAKRLKDMSKCTTFIKVNTTHNKIFESKEGPPGPMGPPGETGPMGPVGPSGHYITPTKGIITQ